MRNWAVYHSDGTPVLDAANTAVVLKRISYNHKRMGEEFITSTITSAVPIRFEIGDYITYNGVRYAIQVTPTEKKKSSSGSVGDAFTYDTVKFCSPSDELTRCMFLDFVPYDNGAFYSQQPVFSFFADNVKKLVERIKANLDRIYTENKWSVSYNDTDIAENGKKNVVVSASNNTCWDALAMVKSEFSLTFSVVGRTIYVGKRSIDITEKSGLKYGKGNGLMTIEKSTDDSQLVITRLRAYGSDKNLPSRYYYNAGNTYFFDAEKDESNPFGYKYGLIYAGYWAEGTFTRAELDVISRSGYGEGQEGIDELTATIKSLYDEEEISTKHGLVFMVSEDAKLNPSMFGNWDTEKRGTNFPVIINGNSVDLYVRQMRIYSYRKAVDDEGNEEMKSSSETRLLFFIKDADSFDKIFAGTTRINVVSGINKDTWPSDANHKGYDADPSNKWVDITKWPNGLNINNLMLPGFRKSGGLDGIKGDTVGNIRCSKDPFDPYIEIVGAKEVREASVIFDGNGDTDEIYPSIKNVAGCSIIGSAGYSDSNGRYGTASTTETVPPFTIDVAMPFNPWSYRTAGESPKISMTDGGCEGREFEIVSCTKVSDGQYRLKCKRSHDTVLDLYFPYGNVYSINSGNKFVMLGIELPDEYVEAASDMLFDAACKYLLKNSVVKYKYAIKLSSIYAEKKGLGEKIRAGVTMTFTDTDMGINQTIPIDSVEIVEGEDALPRYNITLSEDAEPSTLTRVQQQITDVENNAITQIYSLTVLSGGKLVGVYNPAERGLTLELGAVDGSSGDDSGSGSGVVGDSFFETYNVGEETVEKQKEDEEGNLIYLDSEGNETTEDEDNEPAMEEVTIEKVAVKLKNKYVGLFAEGWISAYGINGDSGSGSGSGSIDFNRLDSWAQYVESSTDEDGNPIAGTEQWVLSAKLGYELYTSSKNAKNGIDSVVKVFDGVEESNLEEDFNKNGFVISGARIVERTSVGEDGKSEKKRILMTDMVKAAIKNVKLWGQDFDGTKDVKGTITSDYFSLRDSATNPLLEFSLGSSKWYVQATEVSGKQELFLGSTFSKSLSVDANGNVTLRNANGKAVTLSVTSEGYLRINSGMYSDSFVSAYGLNGENNSGTVGASAWSDITGKPFTSIGSGLSVTDGVLSAAATGGVLSVGGKTGEISLLGNQTADGTINLAIDANKQLLASIVGWANKRNNTAPKQGEWFTGTPLIGEDGVMEVGRYIDFHPTSDSTLDYNVRLDAGASTTGRLFQFPETSGTLVVAADLNKYVKKAGDTMTGALKRYYGAASDDPMIGMTSNNQDVWLWRISHASSETFSYGNTGYGLKYIGTGSGIENALTLYSDGYNPSTGVSTRLAAVSILQDGKIGLGVQIPSYRLHVITSEYETMLLSRNAPNVGVGIVFQNTAGRLGRFGFGAGEGFRFDFGSNNTKRMQIDENGVLSLYNANGNKVSLKVTTGGYLEVDGGMYSTSFVSAYGLNGASNGGGVNWGGVTGTGNVIVGATYEDGVLSFQKGTVQSGADVSYIQTVTSGQTLGTLTVGDKTYDIKASVGDAGGNVSSVKGIKAKMFFSGNNLPDAPVGGWVAGLTLAANWNNDYRYYLLRDNGSRWWISTGSVSDSTTSITWRQIAYTTDTIDKAKTLATARTLWGQSFDGTANVKGTLTSDYFRLNDTAGNPSLRLDLSDVSYYFQAYTYTSGSSTTKGLWIGSGVSSNKSLHVDENGNVSIKHNFPSEALDVSGNLLLRGGSLDRKMSLTSNGNLMAYATNNGTAWVPTWHVYKNDGSVSVGRISGAVVDGETVNYYYYGGAGYGKLYGSDADPHMIIKHSTGFVGIGTMKPQTRLHVGSTTYDALTLTRYGSANGVSIYFTTNGDANTFYGRFGYSAGEGFRWDVGTTSAYSMVLSSSGNLGIALGDTMPSYRVDVGGTVRATALRLKNGTKEVVLTVDANGYLKVSSGMYSDSFISAYGVNNSGSGGALSYSLSTEGTGNAVTSVSLTGTVFTVKYGTIDSAPGLSGYLLKSDVASWAKASSKPSYSYGDGYLSGFGTAASHAHGDYVTALSFSSNKLQWSKGGTEQTAITIGYATESGSCSGNAASATKLYTSRTLWGQSFDGTANVTGSLNSVGNILPSSTKYYDVGSNSLSMDYGYFTAILAPTSTNLRLGAGNSIKMTVTYGEGYVGIGTTTPSHMLDVTEDIRTRGSLYIGTNDEAYIWYDKESKCLRTNVGIVSESYMSAYGLDPNATKDTELSVALKMKKGHLYLDGATGSSIENTTQIIFRQGTTSPTEHIALSSLNNRLFINQGDGNSTRQTWIGCGDATTVFGSTGHTFMHSNVVICDATNMHSDYALYVKKVSGKTYSAFFSDSININGSVVSSSDIRLKNVGADVLLDVKDIASAPCFEFTYKDDDIMSTHVGTSAQYWNDILPNAVNHGENDMLTLDYIALSYSACVALAKKSENHEERIKALEEENDRLRSRIVELEK